VLALKGRRKGLQLKWGDLVNGEAALATALNASLAALAPTRKPKQASEPVRVESSEGKLRGKAKAGK
jgi:hypothetical protein